MATSTHAEYMASYKAVTAKLKKCVRFRPPPYLTLLIIALQIPFPVYIVFRLSRSNLP